MNKIEINKYKVNHYLCMKYLAINKLILIVMNKHLVMDYFVMRLFSNVVLNFLRCGSLY